MYKLVSEYGNEVVYTADENKKNQLLDKGFHIDSRDAEPAVKTEKKARTKNSPANLQKEIR